MESRILHRGDVRACDRGNRDVTQRSLQSISYIDNRGFPSLLAVPFQNQELVAPNGIGEFKTSIRGELASGGSANERVTNSYELGVGVHTTQLFGDTLRSPVASLPRTDQ